jgi:hypothetical protein
MRLTRFAWARFGMITYPGRRDGAVTMVTLSDENLLSPANERTRFYPRRAPVWSVEGQQRVSRVKFQGILSF